MLNTLIPDQYYSRPTYSGIPLAQKLGIKKRDTIMVVNRPENYYKLLTELPQCVTFTKNADIKKEIIHYFCLDIEALKETIGELINQIQENGMIWISWPKKASGTQTNVSENGIRDIALHSGLVDVKVCSVDTEWSALKVVKRIKDRKQEK